MTVVGLGACAVAALIAGATVAVAAEEPGRQVVVVYNVQEPASQPLAEYYAAKRGVPTNQLCAVSVRPVETITRQEFNDQIRAPIMEFLSRHNLWRQEPRTVRDPVLGPVPAVVTVANQISYLVLIYGVPLRIEHDPRIIEQEQAAKLPKAFRRSEAAVESELALLPRTDWPLLGAVPNPFYNSVPARFTGPQNLTMLLVGRLDGPSPAVVRRLIDDALTAERYGLQGRAYFDARGTTEKGYVQGDDWLRAAARAFREAGFETDFDDRPELFGEDYPMTDVAVYAGWYAGNVTGPFLRKDFRFQTGAVAYHIHSASGASVRSSRAYWVGPFLARGVAATMGNVFEPYLSLTPHLDLFFQRLLEGSTFLEAGYASQPALSWQTTFVGDPLYRPFGLSLDEQIAHLEADHRPEAAWAYVRQANLLVARGQIAAADDLCRRQARRFPDGIVDEKLGDLLRMAHQETEAVAPYQRALAASKDRYRYLRVATKLAATLEALNQLQPALVVYEQLAEAYATNHRVIDFYKKARNLAAALHDDARMNRWQARIDAWLRRHRPGEKK